MVALSTDIREAELNTCRSVSALAARSKKASKQFEVFIAFPSRLESAAKKGFTVPRRWLEAPAVSEWLKSKGFSTQNVKQLGGLLLSVTEREPEAAA